MASMNSTERMEKLCIVSKMYYAAVSERIVHFLAKYSFMLSVFKRLVTYRLKDVCEYIGEDCLFSQNNSSYDDALHFEKINFFGDIGLFHNLVFWMKIFTPAIYSYSSTKQTQSFIAFSDRCTLLILRFHKV